jgi:hypothetical protein
MLIENKVVFLAVPKCASTSVLNTCLVNELQVEFANQMLNNTIREKGFLSFRYHEPIEALVKRFGTTLPYVAIKRDPVKRFISGWDFFINGVAHYFPDKLNELQSLGSDYVVSLILRHTKSCDLLVDMDITQRILDDVLNDHGLVTADEKSHRLMRGRLNTMTSQFHYHKNKPFIKLYDINEAHHFETYMSEITGIEFKLRKDNVNQSKTSLCADNKVTEFVMKHVEPNLPKRTLI